MNELEKEINYEIGKNYGGQHVASMCHQMATDGKKDGFKKGANFVLSKNLAVLFGEWLTIYIYDKYNWVDRSEVCNGKRISNVGELYDYWINNIYKK